MVGGEALWPAHGRLDTRRAYGWHTLDRPVNVLREYVPLEIKQPKGKVRRNLGSRACSARICLRIGPCLLCDVEV